MMDVVFAQEGCKFCMKNESSKDFKIVNKTFSIWKPYRRLFTSGGKSTCQFCSSQLIKTDTIIPISKDKDLILCGHVCPKCNSMFIEDTADIIRMIKDNPYSKGFYVDNIAYWQYSENEMRKEQQRRLQQKIGDARVKKEKRHQEKKNLLNSVNSSVVIISVVFDDKSRKDFIIANELKNCNDTNVFHYSSLYGRELLTAAFISARRKHGKLNGQGFYVSSTFTRNEHTNTAPNTIIPSQVIIQSEGGYSTSIKNKNYELVDLLLYSPYNNIYECVHATYTKNEGFCYMDISLYRGFIKKHGDPGIFLNFQPVGNGKIGELNEESILRGYGYTVSKNENLSSKTRRELLTELVDLNILTVSKIAHHLDFCIQLHNKPEHLDAVIKWNSDKEFIENYKANPARFMVTKQF